MEEAFVQLKGIKKAYEGVWALKGVDLELRRGEIHCLAGGNGCGKSTLIKTISGVHEPTEGEIYIEGQRMQHMRPLDAIQKGIQVIYQDFAVFPNLTVAENIALNTEIRSKNKLVNERRIRKIASDAMAQIGTELDPDARLEELSVAGKQMVALCRAIINEPKLLILDEPTTALTAREVKKLWAVIKGLKEKGIAILLVDHKFDEIQMIADRLTVLRNGEFVFSGPISEYGHHRFQQDMTGHDFSTDKYRPAPSGENILTVEHLSCPGAVVPAMVLAVLASLLVGAACGLFNGFIIGYFRLPAMLVTLCSFQLFNGLVYGITGGPAITGMCDAFKEIANGTIPGTWIPWVLPIFLVVVAVVAFILRNTVLGREIYYLGSNQKASMFSGIRTVRVSVMTYMISGILGGLAGLLMTSHLNAAKSSNGSSYTLLSVLIVVLGGVHPDGGKGGILGVTLSILLMQMVSNAFTLMHISQDVKNFANGLLLIITLVAVLVVRKRSGKRKNA